jgi:hypothetical protein
MFFEITADTMLQTLICFVHVIKSDSSVDCKISLTESVYLIPLIKSPGDPQIRY